MSRQDGREPEMKELYTEAILGFLLMFTFASAIWFWWAIHQVPHDLKWWEFLFWAGILLGETVLRTIFMQGHSIVKFLYLAVIAAFTSVLAEQLPWQLVLSWLLFFGCLGRFFVIRIPEKKGWIMESFGIWYIEVLVLWSLL